MKMRFRVSTGDECPGGSVVFQTTFLSGPNSVGNPEVVDTPVPLGPRNCDQSSEAEIGVAKEASSIAKSILIIFKLLFENED